MPEVKESLTPNNFEIKNEGTTPIEKTKMVDLEKNREVVVPREVRSWMEKIETDPQQKQNQQNTNTNDDSGLQPINSVSPQVVLPSTKNTFSNGFNKTLSDAGRWLSEFVLRVIKKNKGKVKFKEE